MLRLAADVLSARVSASDAPAPAGANMALARLWAQPWQIVRLHSRGGPATAMEVISTPEAGSFSLHRDPATGEVSLTPLPSAWYLIALLRLGGFDVTA